MKVCPLLHTVFIIKSEPRVLPFKLTIFPKHVKHLLNNVINEDQNTINAECLIPLFFSVSLLPRLSSLSEDSVAINELSRSWGGSSSLTSQSYSEVLFQVFEKVSIV